MSQDRIIFTGGTGLLGGEMKKMLPRACYPASREFSVTDYDLMASYIKGRQFELLIHAAAFTSPPRADKEPIAALETNIVGTANVVKLCITHGMKLIYISTDYVFSGAKGLYREDDPVKPVNKYAWSKLGGECAVRMYDNSLSSGRLLGQTSFLTRLHLSINGRAGKV